MNQVMQGFIYAASAGVLFVAGSVLLLNHTPARIVARLRTFVREHICDDEANLWPDGAEERIPPRVQPNASMFQQDYRATVLEFTRERRAR